MEIKIKKLNDLAQYPVYSTEGAAGFDFYSTETKVIMPGETEIIGTGLAMQIPIDHEVQVRPRSGMSAKTKLRVSNSPGTIDSDFRGEIKIILDNIGDLPYKVNVGDRIAQGVLCPVFRAEFYIDEELSDTKRGSGGFGSSGV